MNRLKVLGPAAACALLLPVALFGQSEAEQLKALADQNRQLQAQLNAQQAVIQSLQGRLDALEKAPGKSSVPAASAVEEMSGAPAALPSSGEQVIRLSADVGLAFFYTGDDGPYSAGDFRVDDARIYLDASVWKNVYFHGEIDPITRETSDTTTRYGEIYADVENLSGPLWGADNLVSLKLGRMYTPYGEEYQVRGVMDDPLVSHSLSDLWSMDSGLELYGQASGFSYAAAISNGGLSIAKTTDNDKAFTGRLGYDFSNGLHLSASLMRTGKLNVATDGLSAMWFGNGFFRALGPNGTVRTYSVNLAEFDARYSWRTGHVGAFGGFAHFGDNGTLTDDTRHISYGAIEAVQTLSGGLYAAARYSEIRAPGGYPIAGQAMNGSYFFGNNYAVKLSPLSMGLGYRFSDPLLLKVEYSPEWGRDLDGESRNEEDMYSTELALRF